MRNTSLGVNVDDDTRRVAVKLAVHEEKINTHEACLRRVQTKAAKTDSEIKLLVKEMSKHMIEVQRQFANVTKHVTDQIDTKVTEVSSKMEARFEAQFKNARNWIALMIGGGSLAVAILVYLK